MKQKSRGIRGGMVGIAVLAGVLFSAAAQAGGVSGEVIDYTLLEKLQGEYGEPDIAPEDANKPRISATRIERATGTVATVSPTAATATALGEQSNDDAWRAIVLYLLAGVVVGFAIASMRKK